MTKKELEQLNKLDEICTTLYVSYKLEVNMGFGTKITIAFANNIDLIIGGLDYTLDQAIEKAIKSLAEMKNKKKE